MRLSARMRNGGFAAGALLAVALGALAGCLNAPGAPQPGAPKQQPAAHPTPPVTPVSSEPPALLAGWEQPAVAILLSGEQMGYLEPCGCSLTQSGGLARRASLEAMLREKGWPVVGLDAGGLVKDSRQQDQLKFEAILSGLKQLNYQAVAAGEAELHFQPDWLLGQFTESEGIPFGGLLVSANVALFGDPELGVPRHYRILKAGDVTIGVTAVLGEHSAAEIAPSGVQSNITVTPAADALRSVLPKLEAEKPDFLVLLSHGKPAEAKSLAEAFPQFSIVLTTGGAEEASEKPTRIGNTLILEVGHKGKHIGVLGYYPAAEPKFRWELIDLDNRRFKSDPRMKQVMREYQQRVRDLNLAESDDIKLPDRDGRTYVGVEKCADCHKKSYDLWKTTGHANAFASLEHGRPGEEADWITRIYDPECLSCHVTGWEPQRYQRYASGYLNMQATPHLAGQQCENCHGPASRHVEAELKLKEAGTADASLQSAVNAGRDELKLSVKTAEQMCLKCHDAENSPAFLTDGFETYWEQVAHPWKD